MYRRFLSLVLSLWMAFSPFALHAGVYKNTVVTPKCITDNTVSASTWLDDGTLIIGGNFEYVSCDGGTTWQHTNYGIAKINPDLTFDTAFLEIGTNATISDFEVNGNTLYIAGNFDTFTDHNGTYHYYGIVALNLTTGNIDPAFLEFDNYNGVINLTQSVLDLEWYDDGVNQHLVIAGSFDSYRDHNGLHTGVRSIALIDPVTGNLRSGWEGGVGVKENPFYYQINSIEIAGTTVYAGGLFYDVVSQLGTVTSTRNNAFAFDITKNPSTDPTWLLPWDPDINATVAAIEYDAKNDRVFLGGTYTAVNGGAPVTHLTVVDPLTGVYNPTFTPVLNGGIYAMDMSGTELYFGGTFDVVEGNVLGRLALYDVSDPVPALLTTFTPKPNNNVEDLAAGPYLAVGGNFTDLNGVPSDYLALLEPYRISGHLFEDVNYGGGPSRNYTDAMADGGLPLVGARVELYEHSLGDYIGSTVTDANGYYQFVVPNSILVSGSADIRVVASSITSSRAGSSAGAQPVLIYHRGVVGSDITNDVGGLNPNLDEFSQNLTNLNTANLSDGTSTAQILYEVDYFSGTPEQMDFGFNFNTVVSVKDAGYGSLRNAIIAANGLSNVGLAQQGKTTGIEHLNFMIPDGTGVSGTTAGTDAIMGAGYAHILLASDLPEITDPLVINGDENPLTTTTFKRIGLDTVTSITQGFLASTSVTIQGIAFSQLQSGIQFQGDVTSSTVQGCFFGMDAAGVQSAITYPVGVRCLTGSNCSGLTIGGESVTQTNIFSNITAGIEFIENASSTAIINNWFGLNVMGGLGAMMATGIQYGQANYYDTLIKNNHFAYLSGTAIQKIGLGTMVSSTVIGNEFGYALSQIEGQISGAVSIPQSESFRIGDGTVEGRNIFAMISNYGIYMQEATDTTIQGNYFGFSSSGTVASYTSPSFISITNGHDLRLGTSSTYGFNFFAPASGYAMYLFNVDGYEIVQNYFGFTPSSTSITGGFGWLSAVDSDDGVIGRPGSENRNYFGPVYSNKPLFMFGSSGTVLQNNRVGLELDGITPFSVAQEVSLNNVTNFTVGGVSSTEGNVFASGIELSDVTNSVVRGNNICTTIDGNASAVLGVNSCLTLTGATSVTIGDGADYRNVIAVGDSGVGSGILLENATDIDIIGNSIGIGRNGTSTFPGVLGIAVGNLGSGAHLNLVKNNSIASAVGVILLGENAHHNSIENNLINTDLLGNDIDISVVPNPSIPQVPELVPAGIAIIWGAKDNTIKANTIKNVPVMWGGYGAGILVSNYANPFFPAFSPSKNNLLTENTFENNGISIDVVSSTSITWASGDGITPNDGVYSNGLPQFGIDYPVIKTSVINAGTMSVTGFIGSDYGDTDFANANIEFYRTCNDGNQNGETLQGDGGSFTHGEPCEYLGFANANAQGQFSASFPVGFANPSSVTAIAYDNDGNTSEVGSFFYTSTTVTPPPPTPSSTMVETQSIGGLACHRTLTNHCDFNIMSNGDSHQSPIIPVVPVIISDESVVTSTPKTVNECRADIPCVDYLTSYLKLGQQNPKEQVSKLQQFLQQEGFYKGIVNGQFTNELDLAVRAFQKTYADEILKPWGHSSPTGYVYITTLKKINKIMCNKQKRQSSLTCAEPLPATCQPLLKTYIKFGSANNVDDVKRLQTFLNKEMKSNLTIDGIYDGADIIVVRQFQKKYALEVLSPWGISTDTGYVYKTTQKKVNELNCTP